MNTIIVLVCGVSVATLYQDQFSSFPVFSCHTEDAYEKETVGKMKIMEKNLNTNILLVLFIANIDYF